MQITNELTLWYDNYQENNCCYQDAVYSNRTIIEKLKNNNIDFSTKQTTDEFDATANNIYVIELLNVYIDYDIFSLIPNHTKNLFKKGLSLLLYYPREGHIIENWFPNLYKNLKKNNLLQNKIFFVFGDNDIEVNYKNFCKSHNLKSFLTPIAVDYFTGDYIENVKNSNVSIKLEKKYDFLFYNGKMRPHRLYAVSRLSQKNLLNKSLTSLVTINNCKYYSLDKCLSVLEEQNVDTKNTREFVNNFQPILLDVEPPTDDFSEREVTEVTTEWHYTESFFSIVSETTPMNRFITEKTYKPILNLHPFIVIGPAKILELLRNRGFYTFEEMFDESYDQELNYIKRIDMVLKEVEKFSNLCIHEKYTLYKEVIPKIIRNREHFIQIAKESSVREFSKIFNTIKDKT